MKYFNILCFILFSFLFLGCKPRPSSRAYREAAQERSDRQMEEFRTKRAEYNAKINEYQKTRPGWNEPVKPGDNSLKIRHGFEFGKPVIGMTRKDVEAMYGTSFGGRVDNITDATGTHVTAQYDVRGHPRFPLAGTVFSNYVSVKYTDGKVVSFSVPD